MQGGVEDLGAAAGADPGAAAAPGGGGGGGGGGGPRLRRVACILAADVVGSSRLMAEDEPGTLLALRRLRAGTLEPCLARHGGRLFKAMGDGFLAEFPSPAQGLAAALDIQRALARGDSGLWLRIGLHESEVEVADDGSDLLGDGVNVAVRLEGFAEPGGVVASARVLRSASFEGARVEDLGERALRNIPKPVRVFRLEIAERRPASSAAAPPPAPPPRPAPEAGRADATGLHDRPAIAVLPFRYRGADAAEQEHLADGVTEEVIHALARWRTFPVVARGSVFAFKGRDLDPREAGRALGARYILEGTLRRRGAAGLRLDALLADAESGQTLLSETFEAEAAGEEGLEDEIARGIVATLEPMLLRHETERAAAREVGPGTATAYNLFLRGLWHHYRYTPEDNARARAFLAQALDLAPNYAKARATLALAELMATFQRGPDRAAMFASALRHAEGAVALDPLDANARFALGTALSMNGRPPPECEAALLAALRLDPSHAAARGNLGTVCNGMDRPDEALRHIATALRLSPHDPRRFLWLAPRAVSHYLRGDFLAALDAAREALALKRDHPVAVRPLVASLGQLGRREDAALFIPVLHRLDGGPAGTEAHLRTLYGRAPLERLLRGLRLAGYGAD